MDSEEKELFQKLLDLQQEIIDTLDRIADALQDCDALVRKRDPNRIREVRG